jgi:hypothetical protein
MKSFNDGVPNFLMYLPGRKNNHTRYMKYHNTLFMFDTDRLWKWLKKQEYLNAKNNHSAYSNAICFQVPLRFVAECKSFQDLITKTYTVTEDELNAFGSPEGLQTYFVEEL